MARIYFRAALIAIICGLAVVAAVYKFVSANDTIPNLQLNLIDQMKITGVPDFELPNLQDKAVKLSQVKGPVTIVSFWATWCGPCIQEFPSMVKLVTKFGGKIKLVTVSADQRKEDIIQFLDVFKFKEPNVVYLWDQSMTASKSYGTLRLPESYIVDENLKLIKKVASSQDWMEPIVIHYFESLLK